MSIKKLFDKNKPSAVLVSTNLEEEVVTLLLGFETPVFVCERETVNCIGLKGYHSLLQLLLSLQLFLSRLIPQEHGKNDGKCNLSAFTSKGSPVLWAGSSIMAAPSRCVPYGGL